MKIMLVAAFAAAVSGCALLPQPATRAAAVPAALSEGAQAPRFAPAFDAGAPVALVPCRKQAALDDGCRRMTIGHDRRGDMPAGENAETFTDATTVALKKK